MNEENTNNLPTPPRLDEEQQKKMLEQAIKTAPTEEIRKQMQNNLDQLNKKNN
jgi:hypothetical protein